MIPVPPPFPDRLRTVPGRRNRRRRLLLLGVGLGVAVAVAFLPAWRVTRVEVNLCRGVPPAAAESLAALRGTPIVLVGLDWVRQVVDVWPAAGNVEIRLQPSGTLVVRATPTGVAGSVRFGAGWRTVTPDGTLGARLEAPVAPVLAGFSLRPESLRTALSVADRMTRETGQPVRSVRLILPGDLEVRTVGGVVLHVAEAETRGERRWAEAIREGRMAPAGWADLRFDDRVVVGGTG